MQELVKQFVEVLRGPSVNPPLSEEIREMLERAGPFFEHRIVENSPGILLKGDLVGLVVMDPTGDYHWEICDVWDFMSAYCEIAAPSDLIRGLQCAWDINPEMYEYVRENSLEETDREGIEGVARDHDGTRYFVDLRRDGPQLIENDT